MNQKTSSLFASFLLMLAAACATTPAPLPEPTATSSTPDRSPNSNHGFLHTVKPGETLGSIARFYTGDVRKYVAIAEINGITDPNMIDIGMEIIIPYHILPPHIRRMFAPPSFEDRDKSTVEVEEPE